eukprot:TRINITY_DN8458_c0_g1_i24.p1 TRINITY_DN8458_c0_g1~~TRINITY_DN8458_c0_g1_i24.p1  ORF type:complete len:205 (-),score=-21.73 TRINITY_DN8458_c0_g1_i24:1041-1655(-)
MAGFKKFGGQSTCSFQNCVQFWGPFCSRVVRLPFNPELSVTQYVLQLLFANRFILILFLIQIEYKFLQYVNKSNNIQKYRYQVTLSASNICVTTFTFLLQQIYLQYLLYYQALLIAADYNTIKFYISYSQPKYLHKIFVQAVFNVLTGVVYWQQQCKYFNKNYNFATFLYKIYVFNIYVLLYMQIDMQYYLHIQEFTTYIQFQK